MIKIDTQSVHYFSQLDEDHFFKWAQEISCVVSIDKGYLHIENSQVSENNLRDLLALLTRYKMPMKQLQVFCNAENESWFKSKDKYWYKEVFDA